jgi:hypothetical protein
MWTYKNECKINKFLTFKNRWVEIFALSLFRIKTIKIKHYEIR